MLRTFISLLAFVLFTQQAIAQDTPKLTEVAPNTYIFGNNATSLAIVTQTGVVVIDPVNSKQAQALDAALDEITEKPVTHVLYSHNHWDHISGGQIFAGQDAIFISHSAAKANIKPNPNVIRPGLTWTGDRYDLKIGGTVIELHHFGPSRGSGMTVFLLPASKTAFVTDIATAGRVYPMFMPDFDIDGLVKTLDGVEALDFDRVIFGHGVADGGTKQIGDKADIIEIAQYLDDLIGGVRNAMVSGGFPAVTQLKLPQWEHLNRYNEWLGLNAMRSVISMGMGH